MPLLDALADILDALSDGPVDLPWVPPTPRETTEAAATYGWLPDTPYLRPVLRARPE
jgi:hypothetical protein